MKKLCIYFLLLFWNCHLFAQDIIPPDSITYDTAPINTADRSEDTHLAELTLSVNNVNNILAWSTGIIAILTFATVLIGYIGYKNFKNKIDDKIRELDKKAQMVDDKVLIISECEKKLHKLEVLLNIQENFTYKTNEYLYESVEQMVNQMSNKVLAKKIYSQLSHSFHITQLYKNTDDSKIAALFYLKELGTLNDICDLEYIEQFDENIENQKKAREIIGIIKHRHNEDSNN